MRSRRKDQIEPLVFNDDAEPVPNADAAALPANDARVSGLPDDIAALPSAGRRDDLRIIEARLFASGSPLSETELEAAVSEGADVHALLEELKTFYAGRGVNLVRVAGKWAFRTAEDLAFVLEKHTVEERRLSKAALETLAIIAYHQPVTRAEIEEVRGVSISRGTLDVLMEMSWIRPRGRRRAPGKPLTYGTTDAFLTHFGLAGLDELPGMAELKGAGMLDANLPPDFRVPKPQELAALMPDELPIEALDEDEEDQELDEDDEGQAEFDLGGNATGRDEDDDGALRSANPTTQANAAVAAKRS
jgi:segregation and condensation protein B